MRIKEDVILLIMNCEKYRSKAEQQRNTWLKKINLSYFHVIGKEELETPYRFEGNILYVRTKDDYNSLPYKVISAYDAVHEIYEYKYIFKTDDDQHLTFPIFLDILKEDVCSQTSQQIHYGGKIVNVVEDHISQYWRFHPELPQNILVKKSKYCNGRFYILSYEAIESLLVKKELFKKEYFEDYAIGNHLEDKYKFPIYEIPNDVFIDFI
jgi:AAA+ superfamily predicted ATPase